MGIIDVQVISLRQKFKFEIMWAYGSQDQLVDTL